METKRDLQVIIFVCLAGLIMCTVSFIQCLLHGEWLWMVITAIGAFAFGVSIAFDSNKLKKLWKGERQ